MTALFAAGVQMIQMILISLFSLGGQLGISINSFATTTYNGYIIQIVLLRRQFCFREKPLPCTYTVFEAKQFA